jgi:alanine-glyoxylate transaminase/serine-glyoxylate transaminase/serine-pyruvate transaminase
MSQKSGRQLLQLPGPTNVPDRILRAMHRPLIDHRGSEFAELTGRVFSDLRGVFGASAGVMIFPSSATGCWESALVNTLSPGDRVLLYENGFFAHKWGQMARRLGFSVEIIDADWRRPADAGRIGEALEAARGSIRAVLVVHNETSTGVTSDIRAIRDAMDRVGHDALLMVDAVSSLGATEFRQDDWGVDVTVSGSQKGLMLPPGLGFCAVSEAALDAARTAASPRAYWDWDDMRAQNADGFFPSTPPSGLLFGLAEALAMLKGEGLEKVFARHARLSTATRRAAGAWGLENYCADPAGVSASGTTLIMPGETGANDFRSVCLARFDLVLGGGLGPLEDRVFRIGHLGDFNSLMLAATLSGVEMGLRAVGVDLVSHGVQAALDHLLETSERSSS